MRSIRVLMVFVVLTLVATACSSDDVEEDTTTSAPPPTETTSPSPEPADPSDGPLGMVILPGTDPERVICGYDGDELVALAPIEDVSNTLWDYNIRVGPLVTDSDDRSATLPTGLSAYVITSATDGEPPPSPVDAAAILISAGITASPRHLVMPADRWKFGPATTANPIDASEYRRESIAEDSNSTVVVIDTGSAPSPPGNMNGAWTDIFSGTSSVPNPTHPEPNGLDEKYIGHGVFAAGIVRRILPQGNLSIRSAMYVPSEEGPVLDEHSVALSISAAMEMELAPSEERATGGGVVNLSLGTYSCEPGQIPLELAVLLESVADSDADVVFVAAAGNDGIQDPSSPFWPAGFSDPALYNVPGIDKVQTIIVGVGVRDESWSNTVGATVWAPGTKIVSTYPDRKRPEDTDFDTGFASWSGTSFAAPFVSAIVARCRDTKATSPYRESLSAVVGREFTDPVC